MTDRDGNRSNPYNPNPEKCCEACIFGSGEHATWCRRWEAQLRPLPRTLTGLRRGHSIPCDCEYCDASRVGEFEAIGLTPANKAVCGRCIGAARGDLSRLEAPGDIPDVKHA